MSLFSSRAACDPSEEPAPEPGALEVIGKLTPLVNVPRTGVEQYVKLRSGKSVEKLHSILDSYSASARGTPCPPAEVGLDDLANGLTIRPGTSCGDRPGTSLGRPGTSCSNRPGTSCSNRPGTSCGDRPGGKGSQSARARPTYDAPSVPSSVPPMTLESYWKDCGVYESSSRHFFGGKSQKKKKVVAGVFDELWKPEESEKLTAWRGAAEDSEVEHLAHSLRGLKYVAENSDASQQTENRDKYVKHRPKAVKSVTKDRNHSQVPIGSIYSTDPWEIVAYQKRHETMKQGLMRIREQQRHLRLTGKMPEQSMALTTVDPDVVKKVRGPGEVSAALSRYPIRTLKSEYRAKMVAFGVV